ncbi:MAG TPA: outer membrane beta-barrel protein, partial [Rhizomicrobium sp.]|nr:outer membrane beta-barrel protein [Rhizomicrobium sp.]
QPVFRAPNLQLTQNSGTAALGYLGFTGLTSGLSYTYSSGEYAGAQNLDTSGAANASFNQSTAEFFAKKDKGRATLDGKLGYSRRTSDSGNDNTSGLTGLFDVTYKATPKTRVTAKIERTINSYLLNSGSEIDTDAGATVQWQATHKVALTAGYTFSFRKFPRQGNNPVGSDRYDIQESTNLGATYQPLRWLQISPYGNLQTRRSTFIGGHYSSTVFGVFVTVATSEKPK